MIKINRLNVYGKLDLRSAWTSHWSEIRLDLICLQEVFEISEVKRWLLPNANVWCSLGFYGTNLTYTCADNSVVVIGAVCFVWLNICRLKFLFFMCKNILFYFNLILLFFPCCWQKLCVKIHQIKRNTFVTNSNE